MDRTRDKVGDRFQLGGKLGAGSFGIVYRATDLHSQEEVAVKVEPATVRQSQLLNENRIYRSLGDRAGFARVRHCGLEAKRNVLVLDLLGPALEEHFQHSGRSLSSSFVLRLADQMIDLLQYLHAKGFIHRDVQPKNLLVGTSTDPKQLNLIDFGMAKRYMDMRTGRHIPYREGRPLKGTPEFVSARALQGVEQSRRDDLESIGWVLLYLLRGSLPWYSRDIPIGSQRWHSVAELRASVAFEELCKGLEAERALSSYFSHVRGLDFEESPDYTYLRQLLAEGLAYGNDGFESDDSFVASLPSSSSREA